MRKIFNKLLNIALFGLVIFALDKVPDRLDRMGQTTSRLVQQVGYTGPFGSIPDGRLDNIDW